MRKTSIDVACCALSYIAHVTTRRLGFWRSRPASRRVKCTCLRRRSGWPTNLTARTPTPGRLFGVIPCVAKQFCDDEGDASARLVGDVIVGRPPLRPGGGRAVVYRVALAYWRNDQPRQGLRRPSRPWWSTQPSSSFELGPSRAADHWNRSWVPIGTANTK